MKKMLLWGIPTLLIIFFLTLERLFDVYIADILFLIFFIFTLFFTPCYYFFLIYQARHSKIKFVKSLLYSISFILFNAIFICPESIQVYLGLREWKVHDIDMLPLFAILPISVMIIVYGLIIIIRKIRAIINRTNGYKCK